MADVRQPDPVKLVVAMLSAWPGALADVRGELERCYGPADLAGDLVAHEFTEYYRDEMGHPLVRMLVAFERLIDPGRLAEIKLATNRLERELASSGEWDADRPVNIDPGYVTPAKLVLASCKDFAHRIYLGDGVYAEATLGFADGAWVAYEWTYPDYRDPSHQAFLVRVRDRLKEQLREGRGG